MPASTRIISGLRDLAPGYDVVFCDIWGVIHNGHAVFPGAADALLAFRARPNRSCRNSTGYTSRAMPMMRS
jgi:ribonucleotide monophosphatase NagD (HAD superfamily)